MIAETSSSTGFPGTFESGALVACCDFLFQDQKSHVGAIPDDTWHLSGPLVVLIGLYSTNMKEMWRFVQVNMNYLCCWLLATLKTFIVWLMIMWESYFLVIPSLLLLRDLSTLGIVQKFLQCERTCNHVLVENLSISCIDIQGLRFLVYIFAPHTWPFRTITSPCFCFRVLLFVIF